MLYYQYYIDQTKRGAKEELRTYLNSLSCMMSLSAVPNYYCQYNNAITIFNTERLTKPCSPLGESQSRSSII